MRHPLEVVIPRDQRTGVLATFIILTALVAALLSFLGNSLKTASAAQGMLSFELAGDPVVVRDLLASWGPSERAVAQTSLAIDYAFLLLYSTTLALACVGTSKMFSVPALSTVGYFLAWGQWLAGLFDAVENYALLTLLQGAAVEGVVPDSAAATLARQCALLKFGLIAVGLIYVASAGFYATVAAYLRRQRAIRT